LKRISALGKPEKPAWKSQKMRKIYARNYSRRYPTKGGQEASASLASP